MGLEAFIPINYSWPSPLALNLRNDHCTAQSRKTATWDDLWKLAANKDIGAADTDLKKMCVAELENLSVRPIDKFSYGN
jgi:hypothetical protein